MKAHCQFATLSPIDRVAHSLPRLPAQPLSDFTIGLSRQIPLGAKNRFASAETLDGSSHWSRSVTSAPGAALPHPSGGVADLAPYGQTGDKMKCVVLPFPAQRISRRQAEALLARDRARVLADARSQMRTAVLGGLCAGFTGTCFLGVSTAFLFTELPIKSPVLSVFGLASLAFSLGFFQWARAQYRVYRQQLGEHRDITAGESHRRTA